MKILVLHRPADAQTAEVVEAALVRSFTRRQVQRGQYGRLSRAPRAAVLIEPGGEARPLLEEVLAGGGKALVLGHVAEPVADVLGLESVSDGMIRSRWAETVIDLAAPWNASPGIIRYGGDHPLATEAILKRRPLCRYDYGDEWNNMGFGRVGADGNCWSLAAPLRTAGAVQLAGLRVKKEGELFSYAAVLDAASGSALWFNRPVGPVDSLEWNLVEVFFADYRHEELVCLPCLEQVPAGYRCAVTMRVDCDEAVESARPLLELYRSLGLPLSIALRAGLPLGNEDTVVIKEALDSRGSLLSHSVRHEPAWSGSYRAALREAKESRSRLNARFPAAAPVRYAVSPFHQTPPYAVRALAEAGYKGFVGGRIGAEPQFLLGRAGQVPGAEARIVSLSAQCMLHGECYERYGRSLDVYEECFDAHRRARSIFSYLDHAFSRRYQYGWESEEVRLRVHEAFITRMRAAEGVWWPSMGECMDWLVRRDSVHIEAGRNGSLIADVPTGRRTPAFSVRWKARHLSPG